MSFAFARIMLLTACIGGGLISVKAQDNPLQLEISASFQQREAIEILRDIQEQYPVRFYFYPNQLPAYSLSFQFDHTPLFTVLNEVLASTPLTFVRYAGDQIVIIPRLRRDRAYAEALIREWEAGDLVFPPSEDRRMIRQIIGDSTLRPGTGMFTLTGYITDSRSGEPLIGAGITHIGTAEGTTTDAEGRYRLELPAGRQDLDIQYIGYTSVRAELSVFSDGRFDAALDIRALSLGEVVVEARAPDRNVTATLSGVQQLSPRAIRELPTFLGEADVVKSLTLLPGVSTVGEGAAGFNVRGGNIDQNLIIQDGAPLYNTAHALGFFSIFNADAIRNVTLYKGNLPASYGGRTSSVLEVDLQDGDFQQFHGRGGVGLVASRLLLEGPLRKGRTSFLAGGRISHANWVLRSVENLDVRSSAARFHDGTLKISHRLGDRGSITLTGFTSQDYFRYSREFGYEWRNLMLSANWKQQVGKSLNSLLTAAAGAFDSRQFDPEGNDAFRYDSGIRYYRLREQLSWSMWRQHQLTAGTEVQFQAMAPERMAPGLPISTVASSRIDKDQGYEGALYLADEWIVSPALSVSAGLRYSAFANVGPRQAFKYATGVPREVGSIIDTINYRSGQSIAHYGGFEPRLSLRYRLGDQQSVKASYNRLRQYIHLISNSTAATPIDFWQLSNEHLPPQVADNFSLGYFLNSKANDWEFSLESYYRKIQGLVDYQDLADLFLNEHLETELISGRGRAYGLELSAVKRVGKWTGSLAYTFSRSQIRIDSRFPEETVNGGAWYPASFDQPHQVTLVSRWQWSPTQSFTLNFSYRSGRPITAPEGSYGLGSIYVPHYGPRNAFRIPAYHRLDLAYTIDRSQLRRKGLRGSWTFAIYNVYFRKNPFSLYFKSNERGIAGAYRLAVIGTAFPSLTYSFVF